MVKNYQNLKLITIDYKYCDFLRQFDNKVVKNNDDKKDRPFVGILFKVNNLNYFAPL